MTGTGHTTSTFTAICAATGSRPCNFARNNTSWDSRRTQRCWCILTCFEARRRTDWRSYVFCLYLRCPWIRIMQMWAANSTDIKSFMQQQFLPNPHSLSNWDFRISRQLGCVHKKEKRNSLSLRFLKNIRCLSVGLLIIGQVFFCIL
jgi:hypothetical protein